MITNLKNILVKVLDPFTILIVKLRFRSILDLKQYLFRLNNKFDYVNHKTKTPFYVKLLLRYYEKSLRKLGSWIGISVLFDGKPYFPHGIMGIFIAHHTQIGKNVIIFQQVTIGSKTTLKSSKEYGSPVIGDNVFIGTGAKIIGNIKIGNNCRIGANAVVVCDLPDHTVAVASPTRIIQKKDLDNRFFVEYPNKTVFYDNGIWKEKRD